MTNKLLVLGLLAIVTMPSCMHPVEQILQARAENKASLLESRGNITDGACDSVGEFTAQNSKGLTLGLASAGSLAARTLP